MEYNFVLIQVTLDFMRSGNSMWSFLFDDINSSPSSQSLEVPVEQSSRVFSLTSNGVNTADEREVAGVCFQIARCLQAPHDISARAHPLQLLTIHLPSLYLIP